MLACFPIPILQCLQLNTIIKFTKKNLKLTMSNEISKLTLVQGNTCVINIVEFTHALLVKKKGKFTYRVIDVFHLITTEDF